jgi:outer membrane protein
MSLQNLRFAVLALFMAGMVVAFPGAARADIKIAVVDFQRILTESKAGQGLQKQLDAQQKAYQDEVAQQEKTLRATQEQLSKEPDSAKSSSEFIQKKADFEKKVFDAQQATKNKREALEKTANAAINDLRGQAGQVVGAMAEKEKYGLVLNRSTVLMAEKSLDITDAVLKQLDAKVTKIDLKPQAAK